MNKVGLSAANIYERMISGRNIAFLIILASTILLRSEHEIVFNDLGPDKAAQLLQAKHLLGGKNFSIIEVSHGDLSVDDYTNIPSWPYGYPLIVSFGSMITGDILRSSTAVDVASTTALVILLIYLLSLIGVSNAGKIALLMFLSFTITPFTYLTSSDLVAISLYMLALCFALTQLMARKRGISCWLILGVLLFLPSFVRYSYYPLLLPIPAALLWIGWKTRDKSLICGAPISLIFAYFLIALQSIVMKWNTGGFAFSSSMKRGFYFEHLQHVSPFPFLSLMYPRPFARLFHAMPHGDAAFHGVLMALSCILLGTVFLRIIRVKAWQFQEKDSEFVWKAFLAMGGMTLVLNVTILMLLSSTEAPETDWTDFWTYVQETRYYAPSMFFIIVFFFASPFRGRSEKKLRLFTAIIIIIALGYTIIGHVQLYVKGNTGGTFYAENRIRLQIAEVYRRTTESFGGRVVLVDKDIVSLRLAELYGATGTSKIDQILRAEPWHSGSLMLLIALEGENTLKYAAWLNSNHAVKVNELGTTIMYTVELDK